MGDINDTTLQELTRNILLDKHFLIQSPSIQKCQILKVNIDLAAWLWKEKLQVFMDLLAEQHNDLAALTIALQWRFMVDTLDGWSLKEEQISMLMAKLRMTVR